MLGMDFEKVVQQKDSMNQVPQIDIKKVSNNTIENDIERYKQLTKIACKQKKFLGFKPVSSPFMKIDVSLYKQKKRTELLQTHDISLLVNYEKYEINNVSENDSDDDKYLGQGMSQGDLSHGFQSQSPCYRKRSNKSHMEVHHQDGAQRKRPPKRLVPRLPHISCQKTYASGNTAQSQEYSSSDEVGGRIQKQFDRLHKKVEKSKATKLGQSGDEEESRGVAGKQKSDKEATINQS